MKNFILTAIATSMALCTFSQSAISIRTQANTGIGVQQGKLKNAFGIGGMYEKPFKSMNNLKFTSGISFGINGIKNMPYELKFNGSVTNTSINYTSYLVQLGTGLKYVLRDNKKWSPYAAVSGGVLNYYTHMSIQDPNDADGCTPLDSKPVSSSFVLTGTTEAGFRIQPKQNGRSSIAYVEVGVAYISGTRGKYLRLENKDDHDHAEDSYMVKFRQGSTNIEHVHKMGTMYRTKTSQLAHHIALIFRL